MQWLAFMDTTPLASSLAKGGLSWKAAFDKT